MSYEVAVKNLFNTKKVIFSNEELVKVIEYALINNLIKIEFDDGCKKTIGRPIKEKDLLRVSFSSGDVLFVLQEEEKEKPVELDDIKDLL
jgi:hypothetical protein